MLKVKLLTIEKVAVCYAALTTLLAAVLWPRLVDHEAVVLVRAGWLLVTVGLVAGGVCARRIWRLTPRQLLLTNVGRALGQLAWLYYWYPDIYEFNRILPNQDHVFAACEQRVFGCQPSVVFSQWLSGGVWSELFNLGYWSYYPMIFALAVAVFCREWRQTPREWATVVVSGQRPEAGSAFGRVTTITLLAFFCYYLIYLALPVSGPQFYFQAVGVDEILRGHFPALGTYFSSHTEMLPAPGDANGLFYRMVTQTQAAGERPIAAFPSSHIGVSTIQVLLSRRYAPRVTWFLLPFWALLCCATVYIQAHYLLDALAGLLSAPLVLWVAGKVAGK